MWNIESVLKPFITKCKQFNKHNWEAKINNTKLKAMALWSWAGTEFVGCLIWHVLVVQLYIQTLSTRIWIGSQELIGRPSAGNDLPSLKISLMEIANI